MKDYHIREMAKLVVGIKSQEVIEERLRDYWNDKVAVTWHAENVKRQAENMGIELTDQQVRNILDSMIDDHDACIGINWEVKD